MARARSPIPSLRQRLRVALKAAGVKGKFSTDLVRNGSLVVRREDIWDEQPIQEFEGHVVIYARAPNGHNLEHQQP